MSDDHEFETFLRRFEPQAPSPLPTPRGASGRRRWAWAAAALVLVAGWAEWRHLSGAVRTSTVLPAPRTVTSESRPRPTMGELSVLLRRGDEAKLAGDLENRVLPDPRRPGGALRVLSAETIRK